MPVPKSEPKVLAYEVEVSVSQVESESVAHPGELLANIFRNCIGNLSSAFTKAYFSGDLKRNIPYIWHGRIRCLNYDSGIFPKHEKRMTVGVIAEPAFSQFAAFENYNVQFVDQFLPVRHPDSLFILEFQVGVPQASFSSTSAMFLTTNVNGVVPSAAMLKSKSWNERHVTDSFIQLLWVLFSNYSGPLFETNYEGLDYCASVGRACYELLGPAANDVFYSVMYVVWSIGKGLLLRNANESYSIPYFKKRDKFLASEFMFVSDTRFISEPAVIISDGAVQSKIIKVATLSDVRKLLDEEI
jgi:hypothetical protein